jgi:hypothetical protein
MGLDTKTVAELQEIAANLREQIRRDSNDTCFYKALLKDAEQLIGERQIEFPPKPADSAF